MKKIILLLLSAFLGLTMTACSKSTESEEKYHYDKSGWYEQLEDGSTIQDFMITMATEGFDMESFIDSGYGEFCLRNNYTVYSEMDWDNIYEYNIEKWADLGIKKEAHDTDDEDRVWLSFMPADYNPASGTTYPLIFVYPGNECHVYWGENIGFSELVVEKQCIVVIPYASNDDIALEEFDRIYDVMVNNYPVDTTRVYCTGFSKGSWATAHIALARADKIAAIAINGLNASVDISADSVVGIELPGVTDEEFAAASQSVPVIFWAGEYDFTDVYPYNNELKIAGINNWLTLNNCSQAQTLNNAELSGDLETAMGLQFDYEETKTVDGADWYFGYFNDANGITTVECIEATGMLHDPAPSMAVTDIEFMYQFQLVDGVSTYVGE